MTALAVAAPLEAQAVRGTLVEAGAQAPLEGAMVVLVDGDGEAVDATLTDTAGRFFLAAPAPGRYTVRADRIGHTSTVSPAFPVTAGDTAVQHLEAAVRAIEVAGVEAEGERRCEVRPAEGARTAELWEEIRKALAAAAWTDDRGLYSYDVLQYSRDLDTDARRVEGETSAVVSGFARSPFVSLPAERLAAEGFVVPDGDGRIYYAPDAEVMLSDPFLDTHCFRLRGEERDGLVGLEFEPLDGRDLPEIRGTLWVDPTTAELRRLDFRYVNLEHRLDSDELGGRVGFQRLPNGTWVVDEWWIRMPALGITRDSRTGVLSEPFLRGIREDGARVLRVADLTGETVMAAESGTLTGVVLDSLGADPVADAPVRLAGTERHMRTRPDGTFRFAGLPDGTYQVEATAPEAPRGGEAEAAVARAAVAVARGEAASVRLRLPSTAEAFAALCRDARSPGTGVLLGWVRTVAGEPLPGALVRVGWSGWRVHAEESAARERERGWRYVVNESGRTAETETDRDGFFRACAVPRDHPLRVEVRFGPFSDGPRELLLGPDDALLRHDVRMDLGRGGALTGRVVEAGTDRPLAGLAVHLGRTGVADTTDRDGRFRLEPLPPGTDTLSVHLADGRVVRGAVDVPAGLSVRVRVEAPPADAVRIEGIAVEVLGREEREWRAAGTAVTDIGPGEMAALRERAEDLRDVLRMHGVSGVVIRPLPRASMTRSFCMESVRRSPGPSGVGPLCRNVLVVVNGLPAPDTGPGGPGPQLASTHWLLTLDLEAVERVRYLSPLEARFQWGKRGEWGVLLVETRRGGGGSAHPPA